jgi:phosphopantothenate synthetase
MDFGAKMDEIYNTVSARSLKDNIVDAFKRMMKRAEELNDFSDGDPVLVCERVSKKEFLDCLKLPSIDKYISYVFLVSHKMMRTRRMILKRYLDQ